MSGSGMKSNLPIPDYKEILSKFDFAKPFIDEPDIFNPNSLASKNFLIQAFAYIHSDFHYLSFLNKEIDQELLKAGEILQILPMTVKKCEKLFDNFSDYEIKKFWIRLFALLESKTENDFNFEKNQFGFLKDMSETLDYVHYELAVVKGQYISKETLNKEIDKWDNFSNKCNESKNDISLLNYDSQDLKHINIEKLLVDLEQVASMNKNIQHLNHVNKVEHLEFFSNFTKCVKNIDEYLKNLKEIDSSLLNELHSKIVLENKLAPSSNLYFLKKCNNYLKTLEHRRKFS